MKKLVIYYSLNGNTELIAKEIVKTVGADLMRLKPKKDIESEGFMRIFWGGRQVIMKKKPELLPLDKNPQDYDLIFLGTPVWVGTYVPAFRTYLDQVKVEGKKVALFCCFGGGAGKTFSEFKKFWPNNEFIGELGLDEPLKKATAEKVGQARSWAEKIIRQYGD